MTVINRRSWIVFATTAVAAVDSIAAVKKPPVTSLAISPDGAFVLAGSQAGVAICDVRSLEQVDHISPSMDNVHDLKFSPDGSRLAVAGGDPGEQGVVEIIRWRGGEVIRRIRDHDDVVDSIDFSSDGLRIATASADEVCCVYELDQPNPISRYTQHSKAVRSVRFLPSDQRVVTASRDETLRVWDAATGQTIRTLHNHSRDVHALALRPGGDGALPMIASASADRTIRFWQPTIGRMVRFCRLDREPLCLGWGRDGNHLIAGCRDGVACLVDPSTVRVTHQEKLSDGWLYSLSVDRSRTGDVLVGSADGNVIRMDERT